MRLDRFEKGVQRSGLILGRGAFAEDEVKLPVSMEIAHSSEPPKALEMARQITPKCWVGKELGNVLAEHLPGRGIERCEDHELVAVKAQRHDLAERLDISPERSQQDRGDLANAADRCPRRSSLLR